MARARTELSWLTGAVFVVAVCPSVAAQDWTLRLEGGSEYDTNIHRLEVTEDDPEPDSGPLLRLGARLQVARRFGQSGVRFDGYAGSKLFVTGPGQSESATIVALNAGYSRALPSRKATVGLTSSLYDATHYEAFDCGTDCGQVAEGRFFSTASLEGNLGLVGPAGHRLVAALGVRGFEYKPDETFDWFGEHYALTYSAAIWRGDEGEAADVASFDLTAAYRLSRRDYVGSAFTNACPDDDDPAFDCFVPTALGRVDLNHSAAGEAIYTGERIYSARYEIQINDSNSFGQSLVRQRVELRVTSELFADVFLTATGAIQLNVFLDPLLLARDVNATTIVSIEDENRNSLSAHLSREVAPHWTIEGRYSIFSNEFATEEFQFRRQTIYVGAVYDYGD